MKEKAQENIEIRKKRKRERLMTRESRGRHNWASSTHGDGRRGGGRGEGGGRSRGSESGGRHTDCVGIGYLSVKVREKEKLYVWKCGCKRDCVR